MQEFRIMMIKSQIRLRIAQCHLGCETGGDVVKAVHVACDAAAFVRNLLGRLA